MSVSWAAGLRNVRRAEIFPQLAHFCSSRVSVVWAEKFDESSGVFVRVSDIYENLNAFLSKQRLFEYEKRSEVNGWSEASTVCLFICVPF